MELQGKLKIINDLQVIGEKEFKKRDVVLTTDEKYPQMIHIEFVQDKCELLNEFKVGDDVKIAINIKGREWINPEGIAKYFNTIQGWKIEKIEKENSPAE